MLNRYSIETFARLFITVMILYQYGTVLTSPHWAIRFVLPAIMFIWCCFPMYDMIKELWMDKKNNDDNKDVRRQREKKWKKN